MKALDLTRHLCGHARTSHTARGPAPTVQDAACDVHFSIFVLVEPCQTTVPVTWPTAGSSGVPFEGAGPVELLPRDARPRPWTRERSSGPLQNRRTHADAIELPTTRASGSLFIHLEGLVNRPGVSGDFIS